MIDVNEDEYTRRYAVVFFCFDHEIYDDMQLLTNINASFIIYDKFLWINCQKMCANGICFSVHAMSIFRNPAAQCSQENRWLIVTSVPL